MSDTGRALDTDVHAIATKWGLDPNLIQAVVNAEGGGDAIIRAVQCSIPTVTTREKALEVLCRSATHAMGDWVRTMGPGPAAYVVFFAGRWAPTGVANDPTHLNLNWARNVLNLWQPDYYKT